MNDISLSVRVKPARTMGDVLGFATADVGGIVRLRSIRVRQTPNGRIYAEFPHVPGGRNGDYYHTIDSRFAFRLDRACAAAYRQAVAEEAERKNYTDQPKKKGNVNGTSKIQGRRPHPHRPDGG